MDDGMCHLLDTRCFDRAIAMRPDLEQRYGEIRDLYDGIVRTLLENWQGDGAEAFADDARTVWSNLSGIFDAVKILCDTLEDCRDVFAECDRALGEYNVNPGPG